MDMHVYIHMCIGMIFVCMNVCRVYIPVCVCTQTDMHVVIFWDIWNYVNMYVQVYKHMC